MVQRLFMLSLLAAMVVPTLSHGQYFDESETGNADAYAEDTASEQAPDQTDQEPTVEAGTTARGSDVSGMVTSDEDGLPVQGVRVTARSTGASTVTGGDGRFTLAAAKGESLVFSRDGFVEKSTLASGEEVEVALEPIASLEKLVVIGYGATKKKNLSSSVGSMDISNLAKSATGRIDDAMQGQVAGLTVTSGSMAPGSDMIVNIRGITTLSLNDQPLFIVDGVMSDARAVSALNPSDIANLQVLKDASTAAIYGSRAANGVILITTRRGTKGATQVKVTSDAAYNTPGKTFDLMDSEQYRQYMMKLYTLRDANGIDTALDTAKLGRWAIDNVADANTDWQREMYQPALTNRHDITFEGGSDQSRVLFSAGYQNQDGILRETGSARVNLRLNTDFVKGPLKLGESVSMSHANTKSTFFQNDAVFIAQVPPTIPVYDPTAPAEQKGYGAPESDNVSPSVNRVNPVAAADFWDITTSRNSGLGNFYAELGLIDKILSWRLDLNLNGSIEGHREYNDVIANGQASMNRNSALLERSELKYSLNPENYLSFNNAFGIHDISSVAGISVNTWGEDKIEGSGSDLYTGTSSLSGIKSGLIGTGEKDAGRSLSLFGRVNYTLADMLVLNASLRRDGSSEFSETNRWGDFPALSAGFNVHETPFLKGNDYISELKLRSGWGTLGRSGGDYYATLNTDIEYVIDGKFAPGAAPSSFPTPDLKWETVTQKNFGADLAFLNSAVTVNADFYVNTSEDMLVKIPVAAYTGVGGRMWQNIGSIQNTGFEASLGYKKASEDYSVGISSNVSMMRNKVMDIGDEKEIFDNSGSPMTITREGDPIGLFYGYEAIGIFDTKEEVAASPVQKGARPGDVIFRDIDGNDTINTKDRTVIGNPWPDYSLGLNMNGSLKRFDFGMTFLGVFGNQVLNMSRRILTSTNGASAWSNHLAEVNQAWSGPGTSDEVPMISSTDPNDNYRISTRYVEDGSYVRLKTLQLGYTVPVQSMGISSARFYLSASNLLTLTKYSGLDPDVTLSDVLQRGIDKENSAYPSARVFGLGTQISF